MEFEIIIWMFWKAFPEQVHDFLAEFAPPKQDKESQVCTVVTLICLPTNTQGGIITNMIVCSYCSVG